MEKAESLSFPGTRVWGLWQSLHNEILVGAKRLNCHCPTFLLSFVIRFQILFPTHSYHTSQRIYANPTARHQKNTPEPWPTQWKLHWTKACMLSHPPGASPQRYMRLERGWSKLATRKRRDSRRGGRNSAAPSIHFLSDDKGELDKSAE